VYALYEVSDHGTWPKSWPKELESLRNQARTLVGPEVAFEHYQIPFTNREQFESAWPHLLKVKSKGAPIILVRGPKTDFMEHKPRRSHPLSASRSERESGTPSPDRWRI
jgi:hypothetical protein